MCVFHSSQFTFMTRNQAAQPPNIIVDTKSGGNSAPNFLSDWSKYVLTICYPARAG